MYPIADYLVKSRIKDSPHLSTRQYSRIVDGWINSIGLESTVRYLGIEVDDALEISDLIM